MPINARIINTELRNLRQKIADTKAGQVLARELGIKPRTITLSDGETARVTATNGILPWLLGGTNPSASVGEASATLLKSSKAVEKALNRLSKLAANNELKIFPTSSKLRDRLLGEGVHPDLLDDNTLNLLYAGRLDVLSNATAMHNYAIRAGVFYT